MGVVFGVSECEYGGVKIYMLYRTLTLSPNLKLRHLRGGIAPGNIRDYYKFIRYITQYKLALRLIVRQVISRIYTYGLVSASCGESTPSVAQVPFGKKGFQDLRRSPFLRLPIPSS